MKTKFAGIALGATLALGFALPAFASVTQNFLTLDGLTVGKVGSGDSVEAKLQFNNTGNSTVQSVWVEIPGSGFPGECLDVDDQNQTGPHTVTFTVNTTGATEGTWDVKTTRYGIDSPGPGANNDCDSTIGSNSAHTFFSQLTITDQQSTGSNSNNTGGGTSSSTGSSQQSQFDKLMTAFAALMLKLGGGGAPAPTTTSATCTAYMQANTGTQPNVYSDANVRLQGFLLSQGASIPALKAGAAFGFFGNQTTAAVGWFNSLNHCN